MSPSLFPLSPHPSPLSPRGFTLTELLVTITIIAILAGLVLGALGASREAANAYATKATIVKLNNIVMERYESYMTRRVPINTQGLTAINAAKARLCALRDLMRMEMPDFFSDISTGHERLTSYAFMPSDQILPTLSAEPAVWNIYNQYHTNNTPNTYAENAKCLYLFVSTCCPEAMEQFNQSEIGVDPIDHWPFFIDGWGRPISWLRCAPGFSTGAGLSPNPFVVPAPSDIQTGNPTTDHDPFDTRNVDTWNGTDPPRGFQLIPLIFSLGPDGEMAISLGPEGPPGYQYNGDPYQWYDDGGITMFLGSPVTTGDHANQYHDNITNHHIEQR